MAKYLKKFDSHTNYETYIDGDDAILPNVSICVNNNHVHYNQTEETKIVAIFNVTTTQYATTIMNDYEVSVVKELEIDGVIQDNVFGSYVFPTLGEHTVKYLLENMEKIDYSLFADCQNVISIYIPNHVKEINNTYFFNGYGLQSIYLPRSLKVLAIDGSFNSCPNLSNITVDQRNTVFDSRNNCNALINTDSNTLLVGTLNTVIPNTIVSIDFEAFEGRNITSITIPNSVESIYNRSFQNCTALTSVTVLATVPPYTLEEADLFENTNNCPIYVPAESVNAYKTATGWSDYAERIQAIQTT